VLALCVEASLALGKGVPMQDGLIATATDDMAIVTRHSATQHVVGVANKPMSRLTSVQVPQTHGVVPASRQGEVVVTGQADLLDEMAMAGEYAARNCLHAGDHASLLCFDVKVPDKEGLVTGDGDKKLVLITVTSCKGCYPVAVSFESSTFN